MKSLWAGIRPQRLSTRILILDGPDHTLLKARLRPDPQHRHALSTLLESLALWQGAPVRAVLVADDEAISSATRLFEEGIGFREAPATPLYSLELVPAVAPGRSPDGLDGVGDFGDLQRLVLCQATR